MNSLKNIEVFQTLSDEQVELISSITTTSTYAKDSIVFYEGDNPDYFYVLLKGSVKIYKVDHKGNEILLHSFFTPSLIAEMASLENFKLPASCVCLEESQIALIKKDKFIIKKQPVTMAKIIKRMNDYCLCRPPKNLPAKDISMHEWWVSK